MGLSQLVNVVISRQTGGVSQAGFGTPLILGANLGGPDKVKTYTGISGVADDFSSSDPEYIAASKIFSQVPRPAQIKIGKREAAVAQVVTITPTAVNEFEYVVTINGVEFTFTSDEDATAEEIVTGLIAEINGGDEPVTASGTTTLILTADNAGEPFTYAVDNNLEAVLTIANYGVAEDLASITDEDSDWYMLILTSRQAHDILQGAAYVEANKRMFITATNSDDVKGSASDDIASRLRDAAYFNTAVLFSGDAANYPEGAYMGRFLPLTPGFETWVNKTLATVLVDKLTDSEITNLKNKNASYVVRVAGVNVVLGGKTAGGEWIDVVRFIHFLGARMAEQIFGDLYRSEKTPYTDAGFAVIDLGMQAVLKRNQSTADVPRGLAADSVDEDGNPVPGYTTSVPLAASVSANDKASRVFSGATFSAKVSGAIHAAEINGVVTL